MLQVIARRIAFKIAFRGAVCMSAVAGTEAIPYVDMRGQLGCSAWPQRDPSTVKTLVIHHTAGSLYDTPKTVSDYHRIAKGWACIGYTWTCDADGVIVQCNDLSDKTNHAQYNNSKTCALALIGNFHEQHPTEAMKASVRAHVDLAHRVYGIERVVFHCDLKATECPGMHAIAEFIDIHS